MVGLLQRRDGRDRSMTQSQGRVREMKRSKRKVGEMPPKRIKRRKYELVGEDWGMNGAGGGV